MRGRGRYQNQMRRFGRKATGARMVVWEVLQKANGHLSADEVFMDAVKRCSGIGIATVYRSLDLFCSMGLARKIDVGGGKYKYEIAEDEHLHLVCRKCNEVIELQHPRALRHTNMLLMDARELSEFVPEKSLVIYGLCKKCQGGD